MRAIRTRHNPQAGVPPPNLLKGRRCHGKRPGMEPNGPEHKSCTSDSVHASVKWEKEQYALGVTQL